MLTNEQPRTDLGNAERFAQDHKDNVRFCHTSNQWLIWNGSYWQRDEIGRIQQLAKETVRAIGRAAVEIERYDDKDKWMKHALRAESEHGMRSMLKLAENEPGISLTAKNLDVDPMLLNVLNGTIDLRSGTLRDPCREDLITKITPVSLNFSAKCDRWDRFLLEVMGGETELIEYLQRAVGYTLTGSTSEQVIFMLYGSGANGKSTFLETLRHVFGDYAAVADFNSLMVRKHEGPRNDLAKLQGARFVTATESDESSRLAEPVVKQLTGGDKVTARQLYKELVEYTPQHKFWLATNHKPTIRGADYAIWRRIHLIPFEVQIKEKDRDRELLGKLKAEAPGILAWALKGLAEYQKIGLNEPEAVKNSTSEYREEQDVVGQFLNAKCIMRHDGKAAGRALYQGYRQYAAESGEREPMTEKRFSQCLVGRPGLQKARGGSGMMWSGVALLPEVNNPTAELVVN